ncbi:poly(U)-specific 3'-to-5' RNA exonuclease [Cladochytrium tenue]|nr:poly(U)-specific 3'-to-5' RNA exonuclease [Cladochytrium tenue]
MTAKRLVPYADSDAESDADVANADAGAGSSSDAGVGASVHGGKRPPWIQQGPSAKKTRASPAAAAARLPAPVLPDAYKDRYRERVACSEEFNAFISELLEAAKEAVPGSVNATPPIDGRLHISLSRTVTIKAFHADRLTSALRTELASCKRFWTSFNGISQYVNDERTRSFLALDVGVGMSNLRECTDRVNAVLRRLGQPEFYQARIGWATDPDAIDAILVGTLRERFGRRLAEVSARGAFLVSEVVCRTLNADFRFPLAAQ